MTPTTEQDWATFLALRHDQELPELQKLNSHYELTAKLNYMHPEILREIGDRVKQVAIAWTQLVPESIEERLEPEGFRLPDEDEADDDLWRVWQENNLDEESQLGRLDALVMKRSYLAVGTNEEDAKTPLVTVESPLEVFAHLDPRTRKTAAALRRWSDPDALNQEIYQFATLYLPMSTINYQWGGKGWRETDRDDHRLGVVPIVPMVNRARVADRKGQSELAPILPLSEAANKLATDMMTAAEFVALPLRAIWGAGPDDLVDEQGNPMTALQAIMGRLLTITGEGGDQPVQGYQYPAADLSNFHESINQLARMVASVAGLPPHYLGFTTDNPASADAIRSSEARLVKRAERKQTAFGGAYEETMRLVRRFQTGEWDPRLRRLETIWRDASTPTIAQKADATVKLYQADKLVTRRQAREDIGFTDAQIQRMEREDAEDAAADPLAMMTRVAQQPIAEPAEPVVANGQRP